MKKYLVIYRLEALDRSSKAAVIKLFLFVVPYSFSTVNEGVNR